MDTGYLDQFKDMGIQCFLNFGNIRHIYFRDMGYFQNNKWDTEPPPPPSKGLHTELLLHVINE